MRWLPALLILAACNGTPEDTETDDPGVDLESFDYRMRVGSLTITGADQGMNELIRLFFGNEVLYRIRNLDGTSGDLELVLGYKDTDPIERNPCWDKVTLQGVTVDGGMLTYGPEDLVFPRDGGDDIELDQLTISASIADDGATMSDIVLTASLDVRIAAGTSFGDPAELCHTFAGFNKPCVACASDNEEYCLDLELTTLSAESADVADFDDTSTDPGECDDDAT